MTISPKVSIALCTYNGEKYIVEQLESLINQTYSNIEIIVVDDQSTDQTYSILKKYESQGNVTLYRNEQNLGFVKNFEKAISLCTGNLIALSDQDDIWECNKIEYLVNHIGDNILIYHNSKLITSTGEDTGKSMSDFMNFIEGSNNLGFIFYNCISGHSVLFRRNLLPYLFPIPNQLFHDLWLGFVATSVGTIAYSDKCFVKYRQHGNAQTDMLKIKNTNDKEVGKKQVNKHMHEALLERLQIFKGYEFLKEKDRIKFSKLEINYQRRDKEVFCFRLFFTLLANLKSIFFISKKSLLSKIIAAYKDSIGFKTKLFFESKKST